MEVVPLSAEALKNFILNRNMEKVSRVPLHEINYAESKLKKEHFLNYIANLRLCVTINNFEDDKIELLEKYLNSKIVIGINTLTEEMAKVLMHRRGADITEWSILSPSTIGSFIDKNLKEIEA